VRVNKAEKMGKIGFGNVSESLIKNEVVEPVGFAAPLQKTLVPDEVIEPIQSILPKVELNKEIDIISSTTLKVCPIDPAEKAQCDSCQ